MWLIVSLLKDWRVQADRRYFLVKQKNNIIGSINFSEINFENSVDFGIYTNPFLQIKRRWKVVRVSRESICIY